MAVIQFLPPLPDFPDLDLALPPLEYVSIEGESELIRAVATGADEDDIDDLLEDENIDVDAPGENGDGATALAHAVAHGHTDIVEKLLDAQAEIDARSTFSGITNMTPYLIAVRTRNPAMIKLLASRGANVNVIAVEDSEEKEEEDKRTFEAKNLVEHKTEAENVVQAIDRLIVLVKTGRPVPGNERSLYEEMYSCTQAGASIEQQVEIDDANLSMLHLAVRYRNLFAIQALVWLRANLEMTNCLGLTPMMMAIKQGDRQTVELLRQCGASFYRQTAGRRPLEDEEDRTCLFLALQHAGQQGLQLAKFLIETCGISPNETNHHGETALMFAAAEGHISFIKYLFEECRIKPECEAIDNTYQTPIMHAISYNPELDSRLKTVKYLVKQGINIESGDNNLQNALDMAREVKDDRVKKFLKTQFELLDYAAGKNVRRTVPQLLKAGACISVRGLDDEGEVMMEPLHLAVAGGFIDRVRVLLSHGANPKRENGKSESAIDIALEENHAEIMALCMLNPIKCYKDKHFKDKKESKENSDPQYQAFVKKCMEGVLNYVEDIDNIEFKIELINYLGSYLRDELILPLLADQVLNLANDPKNQIEETKSDYLNRQINFSLAEMALAGLTAASQPSSLPLDMDADDQEVMRCTAQMEALKSTLQSRFRQFRPIQQQPSEETRMQERFEERVTQDFFGAGLGQGQGQRQGQGQPLPSPVKQLRTAQDVFQLAVEHKKLMDQTAGLKRQSQNLAEENHSLRRKSVDLGEQLKRAEEELRKEREVKARAEAEKLQAGGAGLPGSFGMGSFANGSFQMGSFAVGMDTSQSESNDSRYSRRSSSAWSGSAMSFSSKSLSSKSSKS